MDNAPHDYSQYADPLGLVIADNATLSQEDIANMLEIAGDVANAQQWLQGDIVNYARSTNNDAWINLLSHKLAIGTLNNRASVAAKIPRERRRIGLSFSHHTAVAKLDEAEQEYWLNKAVDERMTRDVLRDAIKKVSRVRKITRPFIVGRIDHDLIADFGETLIGQEVRVSFEIVVPEKAAA